MHVNVLQGVNQAANKQEINIPVSNIGNRSAILYWSEILLQNLAKRVCGGTVWVGQRLCSQRNYFPDRNMNKYIIIKPVERALSSAVLLTLPFLLSLLSFSSSIPQLSSPGLCWLCVGHPGWRTGAFPVQQKEVIWTVKLDHHRSPVIVAAGKDYFSNYRM